MKHPIAIVSRLTCGLLICLIATISVAENKSSQAPAEEKQCASAKPQPNEEQPAKPDPKQSEKPDQESKWKSLLQKKHESFFQWLEKNYPKEADKLKELGNNDPDQFEQRLKQAIKVYEPIQQADKEEHRRLAEVLRKDVELTIQRNQLLRKLSLAPEDQRQPLLDELKEIVSARFDVIIEKKQLEYLYIKKRLESLNKKFDKHGKELQKLKDEKEQSVEKRIKELIEGKVEIDW